MNKNLLVSAVLLASAAGQLSASDVAHVQSHVIDTLSVKGTLSFVSTKAISTPEGKFRPQLDLIPSQGGYDFVQDVPGDNVYGKVPGIDPGLEYQVITKLVDIATGEVKQTNAQYFAKVLEGGKLKAYYCDTTAVCSEDRGTKEVTLEGDVLTISGADFFGNGLSGELEFIAVKK